jgi:hypothetical protein
VIHKGTVKRKIEPYATLARSYGGSEGDQYSLEIQDGLSGCVIASIKFSPEEFAKLVSGCGAKGASGDVYLNKNIGRTQKTERILVDCSKFDMHKEEGWALFVEATLAAVAEHHPGWEADIEDRYNWHRVKGYSRDKYEIIIRKWE